MTTQPYREPAVQPEEPKKEWWEEEEPTEKERELWVHFLRGTNSFSKGLD